MKYELLLVCLLIPTVGGIIGARIWVNRREHNSIAQRLARLKLPISANTQQPLTLLKTDAFARGRQDGFGYKESETHSFIESARDFAFDLLGINLLIDAFENQLAIIGHQEQLPIYLIITLISVPMSLAIAWAFGFNIWLGALVGTVGATVPLIFLRATAKAKRTKFLEQLPDAIDLMVAVLRSGHGVSQAVKAVSQEIPDPCGTEYGTVLHRMNLGQPLAQSLIVSARRYRAYELELIRRAVAIQSEIGGSLAELLEKTNYTLRQRLKLSRQLKVITAQSRLSALIVGILPIILALMLSSTSPGYLQLLVEDKMGRILLGVAVLLEILGIIVMRRMSTIRI